MEANNLFRMAKRQAVLNKVKSPKVETLEDKLSKMSRAELEEEYGDVIQAYKKVYEYGAR